MVYHQAYTVSMVRCMANGKLGRHLAVAIHSSGRGPWRAEFCKNLLKNAIKMIIACNSP